MKYGYIRVSLCGPSQSAQQEQLVHAGVLTGKIVCDESDEISAQTPAFKQLLAQLQAKDMLVVTTLDRMAESAKQLTELCESLVKRGILINVLDLGLIDDSAAGRLILETLEKVVLLEKIEYRERSLAGKKRAKERNQNYHEGRPKALITEEKRQAYLLLKDFTYQQVADKTGFSVSTLKRIKNKIEHQQ